MLISNQLKTRTDLIDVKVNLKFPNNIIVFLVILFPSFKGKRFDKITKTIKFLFCFQLTIVYLEIW